MIRRKGKMFNKTIERQVDNREKSIDIRLCMLEQEIEQIYMILDKTLDAIDELDAKVSK